MTLTPPYHLQLTQLQQTYFKLFTQLIALPTQPDNWYPYYKQWVTTLEQSYYHLLCQEEGARWFAEQINATLFLFKPCKEP